MDRYKFRKDSVCVKIDFGGWLQVRDVVKMLDTIESVVDESCREKIEKIRKREKI
jgi:hypothetical protein